MLTGTDVPVLRHDREVELLSWASRKFRIRRGRGGCPRDGEWTVLEEVRLGIDDDDGASASATF